MPACQVPFSGTYLLLLRPILKKSLTSHKVHAQDAIYLDYLAIILKISTGVVFTSPDLDGSLELEDNLTSHKVHAQDAIYADYLAIILLENFDWCRIHES